MKAELILKNARILDVYNGCFLPPADLALGQGGILPGNAYEAEIETDLEGRWVIPGLIDGHIHLESSMIAPPWLAAAVVPRGTTAVAADPHEIANVCGAAGLRYILDTTEDLPLRVFINLPSCVGSMALEDSGATLTAADLKPWWEHPRVIGLGEVMDVPGVLQADRDLMAKIADGLAAGKIIDGHAPGLFGQELQLYRYRGIMSDHECLTAAEAREKLGLGFWLMIREGSAAKNLLDLLPAVSSQNQNRCLLVTDDRHPQDLVREGHLDHLIRLAIAQGMDPITAIRMATINPATYFGLKHLGAIAPGMTADLVVLDDLENFRVDRVYTGGKLAAEAGKALFSVKDRPAPEVLATVNLADLREEDLRIPAGESGRARVMELVPHQIYTRMILEEVTVEQGEIKADPRRDILKLAVAERHRASGNVGLGLVKGFGFQGGALGSTISHDAHNLVLLGDNDRDMLLAAARVKEMGGGIVITAGGQVLAELTLEIAGLMSRSDLSTTSQTLEKLDAVARAKGVSPDYDPFLTMGFLSLAVVPELKVTDRGLVDVAAGKILPVGL